jgi:signal transduction histidine kinase
MPESEIPELIRALLEHLHPGFWSRSPSMVVAAAQLILDLEGGVGGPGLGFTVSTTQNGNESRVTLTRREAGKCVIKMQATTLPIALFQAVLAAMKDDRCRSSFPALAATSSAQPGKSDRADAANSAATGTTAHAGSPLAGPTDPGLLLIIRRLESDRERVISDWMEAVRNDETIPSADRLTLAALRDDFPEMLQELIEYLRQGDVTPDSAKTQATGAAHGKGRWRHGYRLDEVLRELARVREMLLEEVEAISESEVSAKVRSTVNLTIRRFFDNIAATSARQFVRAQEGELVLRANQLEHAYQQVHASTDQLRVVAESRLSLLRAVNHELRNGLQPVSYAAQALVVEQDLDNRNEIRLRLERVASRLESLLTRLGELSSILAGEARVRLVTIPLDELIDRLSQEHAPLAEKKGLRFECSVSTKGAEITSDPDKLHEIGHILLSNAITYTSSGSVRVEAIAVDDHRWTLRVTDSGAGIDPLQARNLFQEFHSRDTASPQGLHLGLVLARYLARLLGGDLTFQSTFGKGSSFELNLPRVSPAPDE